MCVCKTGVLVVNLLLYNKKMLCENRSEQCIFDILLTSRIADIAGNEPKTTITVP